MNIYFYLEKMQLDIFNLTMGELKKKYYILCREVCGEEHAADIKEIDLKGYINELESSLLTLLDSSDINRAKALYFEYDLDNSWDSNLYACDRYSELEEEDDDWASEWVYEVTGPSHTLFSDLYAKYGFDSSKEAVFSTLYLIARTVCAYKSAVTKFNLSLPLCIAFHDQDPIMRLQE